MHKTADKIKHLLTDINDPIELAYEPSNKSVHGYHKINIYNKAIELPLQKIWIKLPKAKLLTNLLYGDTLTYKIDVALASITNDVKSLVKYIEKLEKNVYTEINKKYPYLEHKSSFKKKDNYIAIMALKLMKKNEKFAFTCYDHNNIESQPKNIESGVLISAYIELSGIWINDTDVGFSWSVLQMKTYPVFNFNKCLFDDEEVEEVEEVKVQKVTEITNISTSQLQSSVPFSTVKASPGGQSALINSLPVKKDLTEKSSNSRPPISFMPSASMLQNIKSNLKKINSGEENNEQTDNTVQQIDNTVQQTDNTLKSKNEKQHSKKNTSFDKLHDNCIDIDECLFTAELENFQLNEDVKIIDNKFKNVLKSRSVKILQD